MDSYICSVLVGGLVKACSACTCLIEEDEEKWKVGYWKRVSLGVFHIIPSDLAH